MLSDHPLITEEETKVIAYMQKTLIEGLRIAGKYLSEEEISYCLKVAYPQERIRLITHYV